MAVLLRFIALFAALVGAVLAEPPWKVLKVLELAEAIGEFKMMLRGLAVAGLNETLEGDGPFTIFAPTDKALQTWLAERNMSNETFLARPDLAEILKLHVVMGKKLMSSDLVAGESLESMHGDLDIEMVGDVLKVGNASIVKSDLVGSNGVIHVIDSLLEPEKPEEPEEPEEPETETVLGLAALAAVQEKTILQLANESGAFKMLLRALAVAGLNETLEGEGPFTIFAPTDEALQTWLAERNMSNETFLARPDLAEILKLHVVMGKKLMSSDLVAGESLESMHGDLDIEMVGDVLKVGNASIVKSDLVGSNGVIHVIDSLLEPEEVDSQIVLP